MSFFEMYSRKSILPCLFILVYLIWQDTKWPDDIQDLVKRITLKTKCLTKWSNTLKQFVSKLQTNFYLILVGSQKQNQCIQENLLEKKIFWKEIIKNPQKIYIQFFETNLFFMEIVVKNERDLELVPNPFSGC